MMLMLLVAGLVIGCGQAVGDDARLYNPELDRDCPRCNLRGADLSGADLSGADLTGARLTGARLTGARLTGADLTGPTCPVPT